MSSVQTTPTHLPSHLGAAGLHSRNLALRRALQAVPHLQGAMLEVGCGTGRFIRAMGVERPRMVRHGLDISLQRIGQAQREDRGGHCVVGSAAALPYAGEAFDVVLLMDVLEHLPDPARGLYEVHRVLRPGGTLHALIPCEGQPGTLHWLLWKLDLGADLKRRHEGHVQRFTQDQLINLCQRAGLRVQHITHSMHPLGQIRDVLSYVQREASVPRWLFNNPLYRLFNTVLWLLAHVESTVLSHVPYLAVAVHLTARKPSVERQP